MKKTIITSIILICITFLVSLAAYFTLPKIVDKSFIECFFWTDASKELVIFTPTMFGYGGAVALLFQKDNIKGKVLSILMSVGGIFLDLVLILMYI